MEAWDRCCWGCFCFHSFVSFAVLFSFFLIWVSAMISPGGRSLLILVSTFLLWEAWYEQKKEASKVLFPIPTCEMAGFWRETGKRYKKIKMINEETSAAKGFETAMNRSVEFFVSDNRDIFNSAHRDVSRMWEVMLEPREKYLCGIRKFLSYYAEMSSSSLPSGGCSMICISPTISPAQRDCGLCHLCHFLLRKP